MLHPHVDFAPGSHSFVPYSRLVKRYWLQNSFLLSFSLVIQESFERNLKPHFLAVALGFITARRTGWPGDGRARRAASPWPRRSATLITCRNCLSRWFSRVSAPSQWPTAPGPSRTCCESAGLMVEAVGFDVTQTLVQRFVDVGKALNLSKLQLLLL